MSEKIDIAIIGGSGLYELDGLKGVKEVSVKTPFGAPSDKIITGMLAGVKIGFIARHNRHHTFLPSEVPYRANIYAFKKLGAKAVLAFSAVGSLRGDIPPGAFVLPDQLVDKTSSRVQTFFGNGIVGHTPFTYPFCECLRGELYKTARKLKINCVFGGVLVCMEGPSFSTRAESEFHRKMGWSLIGMTACPEAKHAREAALPYTAVSMVTDFDSWKEGDEVTAAKVNEVMKGNNVTAKKIIADVVPLIAKMKQCQECAQPMKSSLATSGKKINKAQLKKLEVILR